MNIEISHCLIEKWCENISTRRNSNPRKHIHETEVFAAIAATCRFMNWRNMSSRMRYLHCHSFAANFRKHTPKFNTSMLTIIEECHRHQEYDDSTGRSDTRTVPYCIFAWNAVLAGASKSQAPQRSCSTGENWRKWTRRNCTQGC